MKKSEQSRISRFLQEADRQFLLAMEESRSFGVSPDAHVQSMSGHLKAAASVLSSALGPWGPRSSSRLALAKAHAVEVERISRLARKSALENPSVVAELKSRAVYRRFSEAAEALQKAADIMADTAVQDGK